MWFLKHRTTDYQSQPRIIQIQDEDAGHIFREANSSASISDSVNRLRKNQYNYRDEVIISTLQLLSCSLRYNELISGFPLFIIAAKENSTESTTRAHQ